MGSESSNSESLRLIQGPPHHLEKHLTVHDGFSISLLSEASQSLIKWKASNDGRSHYNLSDKPDKVRFFYTPPLGEEASPSSRCSAGLLSIQATPNTSEIFYRCRLLPVSLWSAASRISDPDCRGLLWCVCFQARHGPQLYSLAVANAWTHKHVFCHFRAFKLGPFDQQGRAAHVTINYKECLCAFCCFDLLHRRETRWWNTRIDKVRSPVAWHNETCDFSYEEELASVRIPHHPLGNLHGSIPTGSGPSTVNM